MNIIPKQKKAAMEMSVGTIVTIVLLMSVLVLGIFLVQKIFGSATNAVDNVDNEIQSQIQKIFSSEGKNVAFYPTSRDVTVKRGDTPKGFVFSVKNNDVERATFEYGVKATDVSKCGSTIDETDANNMLLGGSGEFDLAPGVTSENRIVKFIVPEASPPCTMEYELEVTKESEPYASINFFLILK